MFSDRSAVAETTPLTYISLRINPSYDQSKPSVMQFDDIQSFIMNVSWIYRYYFITLQYLLFVHSLLNDQKFVYYKRIEFHPLE